MHILRKKAVKLIPDAWAEWFYKSYPLPVNCSYLG